MGIDRRTGVQGGAGRRTAPGARRGGPARRGRRSPGCPRARGRGRALAPDRGCSPGWPVPWAGSGERWVGGERGRRWGHRPRRRPGGLRRRAPDGGGRARRCRGPRGRARRRPCLLATGVLDPLGLARAEALLLGALAGPDGAAPVGLALELLSVRLRAAAVGYRSAEQAARLLANPLDTSVAAAAVLGQGLAGLAGGPAWRALLTGPAGSWPGAPPLVLALPLRGDLDVESPAAPSGGCACGAGDLLTRVARCYPGATSGATSGPAPGTLRVEKIVGADGARPSWVEIPGTQEWGPVPGANPFDLASDVAALGGVGSGRCANRGRRAGAGRGATRRPGAAGRSQPRRHARRTAGCRRCLQGPVPRHARRRRGRADREVPGAARRRRARRGAPR